MHGSSENPLHRRGGCRSDSGREGRRGGLSQQRITHPSAIGATRPLSLAPPRRGIFSCNVAPQRGMKNSLANLKFHRAITTEGREVTTGFGEGSLQEKKEEVRKHLFLAGYTNWV